MADTLEKLMDLAEAEIRLRGYHAVSFRDLAASLGIKSASVHYYFRQKEDLGVALVRRYGERFFASLEAEAANQPDSPIKAIVETYREALAASDRICLCAMLGAESAGLPDALAAEVATFFKANVKWVSDALPTALSKPVRRRRSEHVIGTLQGAMMLAGSLKDQAIFDRAAQDLLNDVAG